MMRHVTATTLCMCLLLAPSTSHAQLHEVVKACKASVPNYVICLIIDKAIEKGIEVGYGELADYVTGNADKLEGSVVQLSPKEKEEIETGGIPWVDLKPFLVSTFGSKKVNAAQAQAIIQASCQTKLSPICAKLGFPHSDNLVADCSASLTQSVCETKILCAWKGGSCVRSGAGTKDLLKDLPKN